MKLAVIGSRSFNNYKLLSQELENINFYKPVSLVISGGAIGADQLAEQWAKEKELPTKVFLPVYFNSTPKLNKFAPLKRNKLIVEACDSLIAFWDGKSKGTKFTIDYAKQLNKEVLIVGVNLDERL